MSFTSAAGWLARLFITDLKDLMCYHEPTIIYRSDFIFHLAVRIFGALVHLHTRGRDTRPTGSHFGGGYSALWVAFCLDPAVVFEKQGKGRLGGGEACKMVNLESGLMEFLPGAWINSGTAGLGKCTC